MKGHIEWFKRIPEYITKFVNGLFQWIVGFVLKIWSSIVHVLSVEFLLTRKRRANGGDVILFRALLIATEFYLIAIALRELIDPSLGWTVNWIKFQSLILLHSMWFGPIFAGVYAALYARFASQWTYLANLYNQIKQAEARAAETTNDDVKTRIYEWKAGFMEDAETLHLATKGIFVSVMKAWGKQAEVQTQYIANTLGGKSRFDALMLDVEVAYTRQAKEFK